MGAIELGALALQFAQPIAIDTVPWHLAIMVSAGLCHALGGRSLRRERPVTVACPRCRYSLVGLESTTCPECGERFTIDAIIRAQEYGGSIAPSADAGPTTIPDDASGTRAPAGARPQPS